MDSSSLNPPRTPVRASSRDVSPPQRNSMEDADSSVTRKRPRLDSGERAYQSMSAEPSSPRPGSSSEHDHNTFPSTPSLQHDENDTRELKAETTEHRLSGTPSKVTINVKDSNLSCSSQGSTAAPGHGSRPQAESSPQAEVLVGSENNASSPSTQWSPTPLGSPQIEVAAPEDMEGHMGPTVWLKPHEVQQEGNDLQEVLLSQFPHANNFDNLTACLEQHGCLLSQGRLHSVILRSEA